MVLSYFVDGAPQTQRIYMEPVPMRFGGHRWYFICPHEHRRCTTLVMPAGAWEFASAKAWKLPYQSQRDDAFGRAHRRIGRAEERLKRLSKYARKPTQDRLRRRALNGYAFVDFGISLVFDSLDRRLRNLTKASRLRNGDFLGGI